MGMFDEIDFTCPECKNVVTMQSKAGHRQLSVYMEYSVPAEIAADIEGEPAFCAGCHTHFTVEISNQRRITIPMELRKV